MGFWSTVAELLVFRPSEVAASIALVALGKHDSSVLESVATCRKELRKVLHTHHRNPDSRNELDYRNSVPY
jgi:hypothetical protein